jgi:hypothetical protein
MWWLSDTTTITVTFTKCVTYCFRLYILPNSVSSNVPNNLQMWLRQDVDNNNDNEFQLMRRKLIHELEEIEQGRMYLWILFFL